MCSNGLPFDWRGLHDKCFESIKTITSRKLTLQPIDRTKPEPVWVVSDACPSGCGTYYGQGDDWKIMKPAGFMSKKFTDVQRSYFTYKTRELGIIEALKKWDNALLGLPEICIVTDHEALKTFMQKSHTGPRQIRWSQWLARFRLKFIHMPGIQNRSADALSRIFKNPNSKPHLDDLSMVDLLLDTEGDDLPAKWLKEKKVLHLATITGAQHLRETVKLRVNDAQGMVPSRQDMEDEPEPSTKDTNEDDLTVATSNAAEPPIPFMWQASIGGESCPDLAKICKEAYSTNKLFHKILQCPEDHKSFAIDDSIIHHIGNAETKTLCIPHSQFQGRRVTKLVIDQVHRIVGHLGTRITKSYARQYFWWPSMGDDIKQFCDLCTTYQATKTGNQKPQGRLHTLPIPSAPGHQLEWTSSDRSH
jgi:hypothetical protein